MRIKWANESKILRWIPDRHKDSFFFSFPCIYSFLLVILFIRMYLLCDHMISCSNLCSTSLVGGPISLLPCRLPLAFPAFLAAWVAMGHSPCQSDTRRSHLRDSGKAFVFPERRVRPRGYHPFLLLPTMNLNGTSAVVDTRDPRRMT